jgi:hypothetical protein
MSIKSYNERLEAPTVQLEKDSVQPQQMELRERKVHVTLTIVEELADGFNARGTRLVYEGHADGFRFNHNIRRTWEHDCDDVELHIGFDHAKQVTEAPLVDCDRTMPPVTPDWTGEREQGPADLELPDEAFEEKPKTVTDKQVAKCEFSDVNGKCSAKDCQPHCYAWHRGAYDAQQEDAKAVKKTPADYDAQLLKAQHAFAAYVKAGGIDRRYWHELNTDEKATWMAVVEVVAS